MERVKVYVISALFVIMCLMPCAGVCEEPEPSLSTLITPQNVAFEDCTRTFNMNSDRLFYLTLAAVNANRFEIKEIQSKTGYVLFSAVGKELVEKGGVVRDRNVHNQVIKSVIDFAVSLDYSVKGLTYSSIKGPSGNIEYLLWITTENIAPQAINIPIIIEEAFEKLN